MNPNRSFQTRLVKRKDWYQWVTEISALSDTTAQPLKLETMENATPEHKIAVGIISSLHSRHVGITPCLALKLSKTLVKSSRVEDYPDPWGQVARRLYSTLLELYDLPDNHQALSLDQKHILLRLQASPSYTIFRLAMPLIEYACQQVGKSYLFCEDNDPEIEDVPPKEYHLYANDLERAIIRLTQDEQNEKYNLFWQERAMMLASLTQNRPRTLPHSTQSNTTIGHWTLPKANPPELGLFMRLKPELQNRHEQSTRHFQLWSQPHLREKRLFDAGVDGVYVTRRAEDLNRMLVSELLQPDLVQLDRMVNTGYWATKRPPKPVRLRDMLIVGLSPGMVTVQPSGIFVKTCWFEFLMHFSRLLQLNDLHNSELRWVEGDRFGRKNVKSLLMQEISDISLTMSDENRQTYRHNFLMKLGWLPSYLDEHAYFEGSTQADIPTWVQDVWSSQKENTHWEKQRTSSSYRRAKPFLERQQTFTQQPWQLEQFNFIHIMLFLPAAMLPRKIEDGIIDDSHIQFRKLLNLQRMGRASLSITWVPEKVNASNWHFSGYNRMNTPLPYAAADLNKIAGDLIETWLTNITTEMKRG